MPGVAFGASLGLAAEVAGRLATLLLLLIVGTWAVLWLAIAFARWVSRKTTQWLPHLLEWSRANRRLGRYGLALIDDELPEPPELFALALLLLLLAGILLYLVAGAHLHPYPLRPARKSVV